MGVVYRAHDPELERGVAVKVVRVRSQRALQARERLLREAQALAQLSHPNVISIHDVGTHDGDVFIAMELVDGESLRAWLRTTRPWRDTMVVLLAAGRGLAAAHAAGMVHRDFKP
ncbi:MAG: protein kinase, partial [Kofleriaceae bacterium]